MTSEQLKSALIARVNAVLDSLPDSYYTQEEADVAQAIVDQAHILIHAIRRQVIVLH